jgi:hypothetical protein
MHSGDIHVLIFVSQTYVFLFSCRSHGVLSTSATGFKKSKWFYIWCLFQNCSLHVRVLDRWQRRHDHDYSGKRSTLQRVSTNAQTSSAVDTRRHENVSPMQNVPTPNHDVATSLMSIKTCPNLILPLSRTRKARCQETGEADAENTDSKDDPLSN